MLTFACGLRSRVVFEGVGRGLDLQGGSGSVRPTARPLGVLGLTFRWLLWLFVRLIWLFLPLVRILTLVTGLIALMTGLITKVLLLLVSLFLLLGVHL